MSFRLAAVITSAVCLVLFLLLLISPAIYVGTYGVSADASELFMVRRASPMFAGLAVMLWLGRNAESSPLREALCYGLVVTFAGIGVTGIAAYLGGHASAIILLAAAGEFVLAGLFVAASRGR